MAIGTGTAILTGALASGALSFLGGDRAADAQRDAAGMSTAEQRRQFDAMMQRSQPFYEGSLNAYNSLLAMEGLPGVSAPQQQKPSITDGLSAEAMNDPRWALPRYKAAQIAAMREGRPSVASQFMEGQGGYGTRELF